MEKGSPGSKQTKRYSWIIGLLIFITALLLGCIIVKNIEKEKKTAASYTAQSTVKRINAQLDQYVELSEFLENVILAGYNLNQTTFSELAEMLPNEAGVVKALKHSNSHRKGLLLIFSQSREMIRLLKGTSVFFFK